MLVGRLKTTRMLIHLVVSDKRVDRADRRDNRSRRIYSEISRSQIAERQFSWIPFCTALTRAFLLGKFLPTEGSAMKKCVRVRSRVARLVVTGAVVSISAVG